MALFSRKLRFSHYLPRLSSALLSAPSMKKLFTAPCSYPSALSFTSRNTCRPRGQSRFCARHRRNQRSHGPTLTITPWSLPCSLNTLTQRSWRRLSGCPTCRRGPSCRRGWEAHSEPLNALLRAGVWNVLIEPDDAALATGISACAVRMHRVETALNSDVVRANLMGTSTAWRALVREVVWAAKFSSASMLLLGETGTGKDLLARLIHTLDERPDKGELIVVDCTTLTSELAVS